MGNIVVRYSNEKDDLFQMAKCIYLTDPHIYPAAFGPDMQNAMQAIVALMKIENGLFYYKKMIVAEFLNKICGIILCVKHISVWNQEHCNVLVKDFVPNLENFEYVSDKYFGIEAKQPDENCAEIVALCVAPEFRGKGVASAMLHWLTEKEKGMTLKLDVLAENSSAISLYKKYGFEIVSQYKGFGMNPDALPDCYHMMRKPEL